MVVMRWLWLVCLVQLTGCASIGKGAVEALLEREEEQDVRQCDVRGESFEGLAPWVDDKEAITKVLMVHGVGNHIPGYATQFMEKLASELQLNFIAKDTKNIALTDPLDTSKELGNLRINYLHNQDESRRFMFYELTWSEITADEKAVLDYDNSGEYSFRRTAINDMLKRFSNDTGPDPMIYLGDSREEILISFAQSMCWMINADWDELPVEGKQICMVNDRYAESFRRNHFALVSHSLGSRITIDGLQRIAQIFKSSGDSIRGQQAQYKALFKAFQNKQIPIFMLSNQLPMLQLGRKLPEITGQRDQYCQVNGEHYDQRVLEKTSIIAFSDPNDILSYAIPYGFIDKYLDSRLCIDVTNININVAEIIEAFGVDAANPLKAHIAYDSDERVVAMIAHGVGNPNMSSIVKDRCKVMITTE